MHHLSPQIAELSVCQSAYRQKPKSLSYICISRTGISSWNSNTSLLKNRPGCWLLSFPFRSVLNTQTSMLMGNPWGPATFVPALRGCLSLCTGWQPPGCRLLDKQQVARYWSQSSGGMPAGCQALIGIWWAEDWRLSWFPCCLFPACDAPGGGLVRVSMRGKWKCGVRVFRHAAGGPYVSTKTSI